jgi:murein DD-endopeptidase MepM/ murein hydrolase activator NlpD
MAQLDPRRQPIRLTPMLFVSATALLVCTLTWRVLAPMPSTAALAPQASMSMETEALAAAAQRPGLETALNVAVNVRKGESLIQAVLRTGVSEPEARSAVDLLAKAFDVSRPGAGLTLEAAIARPLTDGRRAPELLGLTMRTSPAKQLTVTTSQDGGIRLRTIEESVRDERRVMVGKIEDNGSLFTSAAALGAPQSVTNEVVKLFAHKIDFQRDIGDGDNFKLIFDRKVTESGRTVATGNLLYAEIEAKNGVTRFYSYQRKGENEAQFFDEYGKNIKGFLLSTPIYGARTTSGFGMRLHPLLGFNKMHTGIDFAAGTGTPILAAGDGVVTDAKWWGGYGRWVRLRHSKQWETGYAHMSQIAVRPGQQVKQGQVIGYVGSTGQSTGPHLHFEVWNNHHPINPKDARVPQGTILAGPELVAFRARKYEIDGMIAKADERQQEENRPQALAMRATPYHFENGRTVADTPVATRLISHQKLPQGLASMKPSLSTTRGMR